MSPVSRVLSKTSLEAKRSQQNVRFGDPVSRESLVGSARSEGFVVVGERQPSSGEDVDTKQDAENSVEDEPERDPSLTTLSKRWESTKYIPGSERVQTAYAARRASFTGQTERPGRRIAFAGQTEITIPKGEPSTEHTGKDNCTCCDCQLGPAARLHLPRRRRGDLMTVNTVGTQTEKELLRRDDKTFFGRLRRMFRCGRKEVIEGISLPQVLKREEKRGSTTPKEVTPFPVPTVSAVAVEEVDVGLEEFRYVFTRGLRADNLSLSADVCFRIPKMNRDKEPHIIFSERDTPLEFLLKLGYSTEESVKALADEDFKGRMKAAIVEARIWASKITKYEGSLLYMLARKATPKIMRHYLLFVEAIVNQRIVSACKLDGFLKIFSKLEDGQLGFSEVLGLKMEEEVVTDEEEIVRALKKKKNQEMVVIAEAQCEKVNKRPLSSTQKHLLSLFIQDFQSSLQIHEELIAKYIGSDLITTDIQLEAAMIYLPTISTRKVVQRQFERFCGIRAHKIQIDVS